MTYASYAVAALAALLILTTVCMGLLSGKFESNTTETPAGQLPGGFSTSQRIIALEFARTPEDVRAIVGDLNHVNRQVMRKVIDVDTYFILAYGLLFALLGFMVARGESRWVCWLGFSIVICAIGTAVFDFIENSHIRQVIGTPLSATTTGMVIATRDATLIKWCLFFVTAMLLAGAFFSVNAEGNLWPLWLGRITGASLLACALVGLTGLHFIKLIPSAPVLLLPAVICLPALALLYPHAFRWKG